MPHSATAPWPRPLLLGLLPSGCDAGGRAPARSRPTPPTPGHRPGLGDFADVAFTAGDAPAEVRRRTHAIVEGMGDVEPPGQRRRASRSPGTRATAHARLDLAGRRRGVDLRRPRADADPADDEWQVRLGPVAGRAQPGRRRGARRHRRSRRRAATILGAGGAALVTDRPVVRFGIDRAQVPARRAGRRPRAGWPRWSTSTPAAYVKRVGAAGDEAFVEAIVYRRGEVPAVGGAGYDGDPRRASPSPTSCRWRRPGSSRRRSSAPSARSPPRWSRTHPDTYQPGDEAGLSGLQARYDDQLRGTPGAVVDAVAPGRRRERELFRVEREPRRAAAADPRRRPAERRPSGCSPASARPARWSRSGPRPATILAAANGPGQRRLQHGDLRPARARLDVQERQQPGAAARRADPGHGGAVHARRSPSTARRSRTTPTTRPARIGRIPLRTALANSCNTAFISQAGKLARTVPRRRGRVARASGSTTTSASRRTSATSSRPASETEAAADMIGQGKVLASPMAMATVIASVQSGHAGRAAAGDVGRRRRRPTGSSPLTAAGGRRAARRCCAAW